MFNVPFTVQTKEPVTLIGPMIAALIVVANVLVVSASIVFQFWKKLFAVVMSPMVPEAGIACQDISSLRNLVASGVPVTDNFDRVTVPSAGVIVVPISLMVIASTVSPSAKFPDARVSVEPDIVYVLVACVTPLTVKTTVCTLGADPPNATVFVAPPLIVITPDVLMSLAFSSTLPMYDIRDQSPKYPAQFLDEEHL